MEDMKEMYETKEIYEMTNIQKRKNKNKGFSLVELIIVIAIMAILVGIVGTQVLPYMEKSREAKDLQLVSALCTAATTAFAENADKLSGDKELVFGTNEPTDATKETIVKSIKNLMGVDSENLFATYFKPSLTSKLGKSANSVKITYTYKTGTVNVQLYTAADAAGATNVLEPVTSK